MNEESTGKCLRQVEHIIVICNRYSVTFNQISSPDLWDKQRYKILAVLIYYIDMLRYPMKTHHVLSAILDHQVRYAYFQNKGLNLCFKLDYNCG